MPMNHTASKMKWAPIPICTAPSDAQSAWVLHSILDTWRRPRQAIRVITPDDSQAPAPLSTENGKRLLQSRSASPGLTFIDKMRQCQRCPTARQSNCFAKHGIAV